MFGLFLLYLKEKFAIFNDFSLDEAADGGGQILKAFWGPAERGEPIPLSCSPETGTTKCYFKPKYSLLLIKTSQNKHCTYCCYHKVKPVLFFFFGRNIKISEVHSRQLATCYVTSEIN